MSMRAQFEGAFLLDKPLTEQHRAYLEKFCHVRHMKRYEELLTKEPDPLREAVGLPVGSEGAYYTGSTEFGGQDFGHPSIIDSNRPPVGQPDIICQWTLN